MTAPPTVVGWKLGHVVLMGYVSYALLWAAALTTGRKSVIGVVVALSGIATMDAYARSLRAWAGRARISTVLAAWQAAALVVRLALAVSAGAALAVWLDRTLQGVRHAGWTAVFVIPALLLIFVSLVATWQAQASTRKWAAESALDAAAV